MRNSPLALVRSILWSCRITTSAPTMATPESLSTRPVKVDCAWLAVAASVSPSSARCFMSACPDHEDSAVTRTALYHAELHRRHSRCRVPLDGENAARVEHVDVEAGAEVEAIYPDGSGTASARAHDVCLAEPSALNENSRESHESVGRPCALRLRELSAVEEPPHAEFLPAVEVRGLAVRQRRGDGHLGQDGLNSRQPIFTPYFSGFGDFDCID